MVLFMERIAYRAIGILIKLITIGEFLIRGIVINRRVLKFPVESEGRFFVSSFFLHFVRGEWK